MTIARILNRLWLKSQKKDHTYFCKNLHRVDSIQDNKLMSYILANKDTVFGKRHNFNEINNYQDFCDHVHVMDDYSGYEDYIEQIKEGKQHMLTADKVLFFESTSGTSSASKLIPYTGSLKHEFQSAVAVWMLETFQRYPAAFDGKAYWSISPPLKTQDITCGGLKIGLTSDTDYFNPLTAFLLSKVMSVPSGRKIETEPKAFYLALCEHLLADESLSFISVWSPNYFLQLDKFILDNRNELFKSKKLSANRRNYLNSLSSRHQWKELFPGLQLISCWTDAQSALWLPEVEKCTTGISIQSKGLLSTEGVVTIPFRDNKNALAYTSHFYEFRDIESGKVFRSFELEPGSKYEVILTTGGGLYRFNTHDIVSLRNYEGQLPYLSFLGKSADISDLVGEKVSALHLYPLFEVLIKESTYKIISLFLYPQRIDHMIYYQLMIESETDNYNKEIAEKVEQHLMVNPYYRQSRASRQLGPVIAQTFGHGFGNKLLGYFARNKGIKDGDVKLPVLFQFGTLDDFLSKELNQS